MVGIRNSKRNANKISLPDFCKYIPLRLSAEERALLTVMEQTLNVSEYTDNVDVTSARRGIKTRRILDGIQEVCHIATGLAACSGKERALFNTCTMEDQNGGGKLPLTALSFGRKSKKTKKSKKKKKTKREKEAAEEMENISSWAAREPKDNAVLFQTMFEICRRNKVLNPSSMRTTYGKLMYMLQDAQNPSVAKTLGFSLHKDLVLVGPYLEEHGCSELLRDDRLEGATQFISSRNQKTGKEIGREEIQAMVEEKRALADALVEEYKSDKISAENVRRCLESIADAISYVESNVAPVQIMLKHLEDHFTPDDFEPGFSLELNGRRSNFNSYSSSYSRYGLSAYSSSQSEGPKLSHTHPTQYTFVWQSLQLWCKVMRNMHRLWVCADDDLLSTSSTYHLHNTGQGLNRVQSCPKVRKVMSSLLHQTQQEAGQPWVGLSVIHLGDRDVPNALIFIDKYTQIPRFLNPLVSFFQSLPEMCQDERIDAYIKSQFQSHHKLMMTVLCDYFKHGFDGSGDDGGSCIDGRLTSSWNWTSRVAKKPYYHALMLSGFQGFDGDFK